MLAVLVVEPRAFTFPLHIPAPFLCLLRTRVSLCHCVAQAGCEPVTLLHQPPRMLGLQAAPPHSLTASPKKLLVTEYSTPLDWLHLAGWAPGLVPPGLFNSSTQGYNPHFTGEAADARLRGGPEGSDVRELRAKALHPLLPDPGLRGPTYLDPLDAFCDDIRMVHGHQGYLDSRHPAHCACPHACGHSTAAQFCGHPRGHHPSDLGPSAGLSALVRTQGPRGKPRGCGARAGDIKSQQKHHCHLHS